MKHLILALGLLSAGAAHANKLSVTVKSEAESVSIAFKTVQTLPSMCFMKTQKLDLTAPNGTAEGKISVTAATDPRGICLAAFGPHRGAVEFARGSALPKLADGKYAFAINGEDYGTLVVDANGAELVAQAIPAVEDGKFTLYKDPQHTPSPNCDIHTTLTLKTDDAGVTANLVDGVTGMCRIAVRPNPRSYTLTTAKADGCGIQVYEGKGERGTVVVKDYRKMICDLYVPYAVAVTETSAAGETTLYGK